MYNNTKRSNGFPDPLSPPIEKEKKEYGIQYAKAIEAQWGKVNESNSLISKRNAIFEKCRKYAKGIQDTSIYKQLLHTLNPNDGDGTLLNIDYTPVPILPKFVRVVVNKILSKDPYPNLEANDPISSSKKNERKSKIKAQIEARQELIDLKQSTGVVIADDPEKLPETLEEAEIFIGSNIKTDAEISAQIATSTTLTWNSFVDGAYRRCVNDIASIGLAVVKRSNDPNYGIKLDYVDPAKFVHSKTEDPNFDDLIYAGHIKRVSIQELRRLAGDDIDEEGLKKIAHSVKNKYGNDPDLVNRYSYESTMGRNAFGYDEYMVDVLDFEFKCVEQMFFEERVNKYGNENFYFKGFSGQKGNIHKQGSKTMDIEVVYEGSYVLDCDGYIFNYGKKKNIPKNIHDISRARLSYSVVATNINEMIPKSMVDSCVGFADMLQLTHLKIQQAIAKAKPDGLIIDVEGLENVQLGKGGDLQPLELHDIYEQTGVFYYRSKNPEGGFQNPPIREIGNTIRNINELIGIYNHYLRMIRDVTGINEVIDASSPKGDALVGVREQAINASNNATYDITNTSLLLFKKVCEDVVKSIQVIHPNSTLYSVYENAIGKENMKVVSSFSDLPMYNFGVTVVKEMEDADRAYLEQNIQISLQQKELDIEDAIAIRSLKDINQAERLLIVRRKKRMKKLQEQAMQNSQQQAQIQQQSAQAASQAKMQELQLQAQINVQEMQLKAQFEMELEKIRHQNQKELEIIKAQVAVGLKGDDQNFMKNLESFKEDRKDSRVVKQSIEQERLIQVRKQ
jgi:hypothetical protein